MLWFIEFGRGTALPQTPEEPPQHGDFADAVGKRPPGRYRWNCCSCELLSPCCERTYGERQPAPPPAVDRSLVELAAVTNLPSFSGEVVVTRRRPPPDRLYVHPPLQRSHRRDWRMLADSCSTPDISVLENAAPTLLPATNQSSDAVASDEEVKSLGRSVTVHRSFDGEISAVPDISTIGNDTVVNQMCLPCRESFETFPRRKHEYSSSKEVVVTQQLNGSTSDLVKYKLSTISTGVLSEDKQLLKGISFLPLLNTCIGKSRPAESLYEEIELHRPPLVELCRSNTFHRTLNTSNKDVASKNELSVSNSKDEEIVLGRMSPTVVTGALKKRSESQKSPSGKRAKSLSRAKTFHRSRTAYGKITGSLRKSSSPRMDYSESEAEQETPADGRRVSRNSLPLDTLGRLLPPSLAPDEQVHQKVFITSSGSTCSDFVTADSFSPCAENASSSRRSTCSDLFATGSDVTASEMDTIFNDLHSYTDDDIGNEMISSDEHFLSNTTASVDENELDCSKILTDDESDAFGIDHCMAAGMEDPYSPFCTSLQEGSSTLELGDAGTPKAHFGSSEALSESQLVEDNASSTGESTITPRHALSCSEDNRRPFGYNVAAAFLDRSDRDLTEGTASSNESNLVTAGSDPSDSQAAVTSVMSCCGDVGCSHCTCKTTNGSDVVISCNANKSLKNIAKKASFDSGINVGDKHFADEDINGSEVAVSHVGKVAVSNQNDSFVNEDIGNSHAARKHIVGAGEVESNSLETETRAVDDQLQAEASADAGGMLESVHCAGEVSANSENKCFLL